MKSMLAICLLALSGFAAAQTTPLVYNQAQASTTVVASLPACSTTTRGLMYIVTDSLTPVVLSAVAGGGTSPTGGGDDPYFVTQLTAWMNAHAVYYAAYWDSTASFNGMLSNGGWPNSGAVYKSAY